MMEQQQQRQKDATTPATAQNHHPHAGTNNNNHRNHHHLHSSSSTKTRRRAAVTTSFQKIVHQQQQQQHNHRGFGTSTTSGPSPNVRSTIAGSTTSIVVGAEGGSGFAPQQQQQSNNNMVRFSSKRNIHGTNESMNNNSSIPFGSSSSNNNAPRTARQPKFETAPIIHSTSVTTTSRDSPASAPRSPRPQMPSSSQSKNTNTNRKSINFAAGTAGGDDPPNNNNNNKNNNQTNVRQCCTSLLHGLLMCVTLGMGQQCGGRTRMERNQRALLNMQRVYQSNTWQGLRIFGAFVLIFGPAIQLLFNKQADLYFFIMFSIVLVLLVADMIICSCVHPTYFLWKWPCCPQPNKRGWCGCISPELHSLCTSRRYWCCNVNLWQRRTNVPSLGGGGAGSTNATSDHYNKSSSTYPEQQSQQHQRSTSRGETTTTTTSLRHHHRIQFGSFMFWLDLISTLSFLPEVFFPIWDDPMVDVITLDDVGVPIDHVGLNYEVLYIDSITLFYIIGRTARLARFIRPDMAVKLSSYFNWYSIKALTHDIVIWIVEGRWLHWCILKFLQICDCCCLRGKCQRMWQRETAAITIQRAYRRHYYQEGEGTPDVIPGGTPGTTPKQRRGLVRSTTTSSGGNTTSGVATTGTPFLSRKRTSMGDGVRSSLINISRLSSALTEKVDANNMSSLHHRHRRRISKYNKRSQVGAAMRELTAQRIALLIVVALIVSVAFLYQEYDITPTSVTVMLHSQTTNTDLFVLLEDTTNDVNADNNNNNNNSTTLEQQQQLYDEYITMALKSARAIQPMMYRYDFANGSSVVWNVPGYNIEHLRESETLKVTVVSSFEDEHVTTSAHFITRQEAFFSSVQLIVSEVFIVILWILGIIGFAGPIMTLVVTPIERMIRLLEILTRDPLGYQTTPRFKKFVDEEYEIAKMTSWNTSVLSGMETSFLMSTILRIGSLMRVGFGSAGVEIIRNNLNSGTSRNSLAFDQTGSTVSCIFLFCDIRSFTDCTEALQEEVFVFTNRIAGVVHSICSAYDGSANKNIGDAFLLSWRLDEGRSSLAMDASSRSLGSNRGATTSNINHVQQQHSRDASLGSVTDKFVSKGFAADKALYSVIKVCQALVHDNYFLAQMSSQAKSRLLAKLKGREGPVVQIGFGLHAGEAVQGAIGSHRKIDATYLSETVDRSETLESLTKRYGVKVLMSGQFHELLSSSTRRKCRKVDQILVDEIDEEGLSGYDAVELGITLDLYTYDFDVDIKLQEKIELRKLTTPKRQMSRRFDSRKNFAAAAAAAAAAGWDDDCEDMVDERNFMARMKQKMGGSRKMSSSNNHNSFSSRGGNGNGNSGGRRRSSFDSSLDSSFARGQRINVDNIVGGFHKSESFNSNTVEPSLPTLPAQTPITGAAAVGAVGVTGASGMEGGGGATGGTAAGATTAEGTVDESDIILPNGPAPFNSSVWVSDEMRFMRARYTDGMFFNSFDSGLRSYFAGNWEDAKQCFSLILERMDDGPSKYFMTKMEETNWKPPMNFTGYGSP